MSLAGVTVTAGLVRMVPSTRTRPSAIQRSASRREHRPARAITLAMRSPALATPTPSASGEAALRREPALGAVSSALIASCRGGLDEGVEDAEIAGADGVFGMPLHAEAEAAAGLLDALADAVRAGGVDHQARRHRLEPLVYRRAHRQLPHPG